LAIAEIEERRGKAKNTGGANFDGRKEGRNCALARAYRPSKLGRRVWRSRLREGLVFFAFGGGEKSFSPLHSARHCAASWRGSDVRHRQERWRLYLMFAAGGLLFCVMGSKPGGPRPLAGSVYESPARALARGRLIHLAHGEDVVFYEDEDAAIGWQSLDDPRPYTVVFLVARKCRR
jgi:hypothetical protein